MFSGSLQPVRRTAARGGFAVLLAIAASAGLSGCGAKPSATATSPTTTSSTTTSSIVALSPAVQLAALTGPGRPIPDGCEFTPVPTTGALVLRATLPSAEGVPALLTVGRCTRADGSADLMVTGWVDVGVGLSRLGADAQPAMWGAADRTAGTAQLALTPGGGFALIQYRDDGGVTADVTVQVTVHGVEWVRGISGV